MMKKLEWAQMVVMSVAILAASAFIFMDQWKHATVSLMVYILVSGPRRGL